MTLQKKSLDLGFTHLEFFENYLISTLKDDVILDMDKVRALVEACENHYGVDHPYVYISQRKNKYNVNPTIYLDLYKIKNLCGIAIVSERKVSLNMANFEKNFSKVPFEIFLELTEAISWAKKQVKKKKADL